jgi:hypothetical protein
MPTQRGRTSRQGASTRQGERAMFDYNGNPVIFDVTTSNSSGAGANPQALIDFHRRTFGGYKMMAEGDGGDAGGGDGGSGAGDQSGASGDAGGDKGGDGGKPADKGGKAGDEGDKGFPANTPVTDMKPEEQAAYHRFHGRKHEQRAAEYRQAVGGKSAAEVKAELDELARLRQKDMTPDQRAIEDAKASTRQEVMAEAGAKAAKTALQLALRHLPVADRDASIEILNMSSFLTESGEVDTDKVIAAAERIAPARGTGRNYDIGGGSRGGSGGKSGVQAGAAMFHETHPRKTTTS